jgi:hypothetical protein
MQSVIGPDTVKLIGLLQLNVTQTIANKCVKCIKHHVLISWGRNGKT